MSECDSSDHPVSVVDVVVGMNIFSYTQLVSVTLAITLCPSLSSLLLLSYSMSECDSSDQAVSVVVVVVVVVVVGVNFFSFSTSSLKLLHGFASNCVWVFLGW